ncbi:alkylglycerol monooxygenase [Solenopsis invicta]|nr:alkylglycerol monooxygenase [Solenopsis invicta]XP_025993133.1 alkylglycerol monooxygenase [Solenopsis invicta]XP_039311636.1 alkylglycerol monooxygenase [Solenopsis invicta]XP_039311660.1 alkylglycerol monooxygenase [Solenopsis invicta]
MSIIVNSFNKFVDYFPKDLGKLWYIVSPKETTFEFLHDVPDYQQQIWMPFFLLLILEQLILRKKRFRLNDQVTSLSHWMLHETVRIFSRGAEYCAYIAIYERFGRGCALPWNSLWTWYITFIAVDFCYYWAHRSNHEVHFLWAYHQVHHSSEEFNLAVGLRQSILQHWCNFIIYLPLALFIPPSHFMVHNQLNLIYQLWIHTTVIGDLGPLELIFNTPKHHRVHHGCNLYCLDKNYGGVLIIWDRLFDTFQEEERNEQIVYGLVVNIESFNAFYLQVFYLKDLIKKSLSMSTWTDKFAVFWKGPSWFPGGPRLGLDEFKIKVKSRAVYDPYISKWQKIYISVQFLMVLLNHYKLYEPQYHENLGDSWIRTTVANNLIALVSIGLLFDKCAFIYSNFIEIVRCAFYVYFMRMHEDNLIDYLIYYVHMFQLNFIWIPLFIYKIYAHIYNRFFNRTRN